MKILVIGGAGASGSAIVAHLGQQNEVDIIDQNVEALKGKITANQNENPQSRIVEFSEGQLKTPEKAEEKEYDLIISVTKSFSVNGELGQLIKKVNANKCPVLTLDTEVYPEIASDKEITALEDSKAFLNSLNEAEIPVIRGVLNFPAVKGPKGNVMIKMTEAVVKDRAITLAKDDIEANDQHRETIKTILSEVGLGCIEKETLQHTSLEKIADMLSVGIQALMDTTFRDAANPETPTGKIFSATLGEFIQIIKKLNPQIPGAEYLDVNIDSKEILNTVSNKGNFKGSMHPDLTGGKETEKNIFATLAELADTLGIEAPTLQQTHNMLAYAEKSSERLATVRDTLKNVSDAAQFTAIDVENMQVEEQVLGMAI